MTSIISHFTTLSDNDILIRLVVLTSHILNHLDNLKPLNNLPKNNMLPI